MTSSGSMPGYDGGSGGDGGPPEKGSKRKKVAGFLKAANEMRQSYQQSYAQKWGSEETDKDDDDLGIPGAFPDVAIVSHGDEQLILFPSYARRHTRQEPKQPDINTRVNSIDSEGAADAEYWAREWQKFEDDRAIVDVDVRGWIYSPHRGPMSRRNRMLIGIARQLSGVPAPSKGTSDSKSRDPSPNSHSLQSRHMQHEAQREQLGIAREAENILKKGKSEEEAAARGGYSEAPKDDSESESIYGDRGRRGGSIGTQSPNPPEPGHLTTRTSWNQPSDMSPAELQVANANLMARLKPFLTTPLVSTPITIFFYNDKDSCSRIVMTNDAGHFTIRAALEFVPTHIRVLASEHLSATEEVKITEPKGVSIISDVDDTIKHTSIGSGARETFKNAFIRDLKDLTIDGVKEWYNTMYDMGVGIHYVSNAPWQLFPVLVSYFQVAGLPPGSYHLKAYSGMLQGIFEPVAERKKGTLEKIFRDFPDRKFLLMGDSGEADLEVYTDVVLANPGRVIGVFIRDVTTPPTTGFFDSAMGPLSGNGRKGTYTPPRIEKENRSTPSPSASVPDKSERRPKLPPRIQSEATPQTSDGPKMGKLIDLGDEPEVPSVHESHRTLMPRSASDFEPAESPRRKSDPNSMAKVPPPRPSKPLALRGSTANSVSDSLDSAPAIGRGSPPPPPAPRRARSGPEGPAHPLAQSQSSEDITAPNGYLSSARSKISSAYDSLPEVRSYLPSELRASSASSPSRTVIGAPPPPPPRRGAAATAAAAIPKRLSWGTQTPDSSDDEYTTANSASPAPVNKKLDLWKRRWKRAKNILDAQNVPLRSWRTGGDACLEAVQLVEKELTKMGVEGYGKSKGKGKTGEGGGEKKVKDIGK